MFWIGVIILKGVILSYFNVDLGLALRGICTLHGYNLCSLKYYFMEKMRKILATILVLIILLPSNPGFIIDSWAVCGDKTLDPGEECEDGNTNNNDSCSSTCKRTCGVLNPDAVEFCGDGIVQPNSEQCDDGNNIVFDNCDNNCRNVNNGNGYDALEAGVNYSIYDDSNLSARKLTRSTNIRFDVVPPAPAIITACNLAAPACNGMCAAGQACATDGINMCMCIANIACMDAMFALNCVEGNACPDTADGRTQYCTPMAGMCLCAAGVQVDGGNDLNNCMPNAAAVSVEIFSLTGQSFRQLDASIADLIAGYPGYSSALTTYKAMVLALIPNPGTFLTSLANNLNNGSITCAGCANSQINTLRTVAMSAPILAAKFSYIAFENADGKNFTGLDLSSRSYVDFGVGGGNDNSTNVNWTCTNLTNANLDSVTFRRTAASQGALLKGATLTGAMLSGARLESADFSPSVGDGFPGADISGVNFAMAWLEGANLRNIRYTSNVTSFIMSRIEGSQFTTDQFTSAQIGGMADGMIMGAYGTALLF